MADLKKPSKEDLEKLSLINPKVHQLVSGGQLTIGTHYKIKFPRGEPILDKISVQDLLNE